MVHTLKTVKSPFLSLFKGIKNIQLLKEWSGKSLFDWVQLIKITDKYDNVRFEVHTDDNSSEIKKKQFKDIKPAINFYNKEVKRVKKLKHRPFSFFGSIFYH